MKKLFENRHKELAKKDEMKNAWNDYNKAEVKHQVGIVNYENGTFVKAKTYSHLFFEKFNLSAYLSMGSKILQFGASTGIF